MNAEVRPIKTAAELQLGELYAAARSALPGAPILREESFERFKADGLPHRRVEQYKYTDLRALMRDAKPLAAPPDAAAKAKAKDAGKLLSGVDARRLVFVDGVFVPELSDVSAEAGLTIGSMAKALGDNDPLVSKHLGKVIESKDPALALNTALMSDGIVIHVAAGATLKRPLHLVFAHGDKPASIFTRSLMVIETGARATLLESHEGTRDHQVNTAIEMLIADDAHVDHIKIAGEGADGLHLSTLIAAVGARARYHDVTFTLGGAVTRNQLFLKFGGEDTEATLHGVTLLRDRQHADVTMVADHTAPRCTSRELFKSVLDGESRGVFQGKIIVRQAAQKTDGKMATHALLLSDEAEADAKPELEIFADDVQCGHGATAGALDDDLLFYLRARGLPRREAEALLVQAFVGEALEGIEHEGVREALIEAAARWLAARV